MALNSTTAERGDTRLRLWKKILAKLQTRAGTFHENDPVESDTLRWTLVKILRSLNGTKVGG